MSTRSETLRIIIAAQDSASKPLRIVQAEVKRLGETMTRWLKRGAAAAALAFGAAVVAAGRFSAAMSRVQAVSRATGADLTLLRETALAMGRTTRFSATEAAEGLTLLAQAGFSAQDAAKALPGVLAAAAAENMSLGRAVEIVSQALVQFGKPAEDSGKVANLLASGAAASVTSIENLGQALSFAGGVAANMNVPIQDAVTALALFAKGGEDSTRAGTALRNILIKMAAPTAAAKEVLDSLGISYGTAAIKAKGITGIIADFAKVNRDDLAPALNAVFGERALNAMLTLVNTGVQGFQDFRSEIVGWTDAADDMARVMNDNLPAAMKMLGNNFANLGIAIGSVFEVTLKNAIFDVFIPLVNKAGQSAAKMAKDTRDTLVDQFGGAIEFLTRGAAFIVQSIFGVKAAFDLTFGVVASFVRFIGSAFLQVNRLVTYALTGIGEAITFVFDVLLRGAASAVGFFSNDAKAALENMAGGTETFLTMLDSVNKGADRLQVSFDETMTDLATGAVGRAGETAEAMASIGRVVDGIPTAFARARAASKTELDRLAVTANKAAGMAAAGAARGAAAVPTGTVRPSAGGAPTPPDLSALQAFADRLAKLRADVSAAMSKGLIPAEEGNASLVLLARMVDRTENLGDAMRVGSITAEGMEHRLSEMAKSADMVARELSGVNANAKRLAEGERALSKFGTEITDLRAKIQQSMGDGLLSPEEATSLQARLDTISAAAGGLFARFEAGTLTIAGLRTELATLSGSVATVADAYERAGTRAGQQLEMIRGAVNDLFSGLVDATVQLAQDLASGTNSPLERFVAFFLDKFGSIAIAMGTTLMAIGLGIDALKAGIMTLTGGIAFAAGLALVAVGVGMKIASSKMMKAAEAGASGGRASPGGAGGFASASSAVRGGARTDERGRGDTYNVTFNGVAATRREVARDLGELMRVANRQGVRFNFEEG